MQRREMIKIHIFSERKKKEFGKNLIARLFPLNRVPIKIGNLVLKHGKVAKIYISF